ncbi:hypothetical protein Naga_100006g82 [Nannochloropsis gaditana]|uniref:Uncharacterized protein n=1 Tax=Nannochloropsis gaditana TaxID=72520 RepID=W7TTY5_9STRA|nr:hypothetical protein Naga_100006g82 [Nannochloropsis gaditana]
MTSALSYSLHLALLFSPLLSIFSLMLFPRFFLHAVALSSFRYSSSVSSSLPRLPSFCPPPFLPSFRPPPRPPLFPPRFPPPSPPSPPSSFNPPPPPQPRPHPPRPRPSRPPPSSFSFALACFPTSPMTSVKWLPFRPRKHRT